jgi:hypothetical protein
MNVMIIPLIMCMCQCDPLRGPMFALIHLKAIQSTIAPLSFCEFLFNTNDIHMLGLCSFMLSTFEYLFIFQSKDMSFSI